MSLQRPSAFEDSPEELIAKASTFRLEAVTPIDAVLFVRQLAKALEKERIDRAHTATTYKAMNLEYAALEERTKGLLRWRLYALVSMSLALTSIVATFLKLWH